MAEEGFFNTLRNAPELIILTIFMGVILVKWMLMVRDVEKYNKLKAQGFWIPEEEDIIEPNFKKIKLKT